jgi:hypothetical protein
MRQHLKVVVKRIPYSEGGVPHDGTGNTCANGGNTTCGRG